MSSAEQKLLLGRDHLSECKIRVKLYHSFRGKLYQSVRGKLYHCFRAVGATKSAANCTTC